MSNAIGSHIMVLSSTGRCLGYRIINKFLNRVSKEEEEELADDDDEEEEEEEEKKQLEEEKKRKQKKFSLNLLTHLPLLWTLSHALSPLSSSFFSCSFLSSQLLIHHTAQCSLLFLSSSFSLVTMKLYAAIIISSIQIEFSSLLSSIQLDEEKEAEKQQQEITIHTQLAHSTVTPTFSLPIQSWLVDAVNAICKSDNISSESLQLLLLPSLYLPSVASCIQIEILDFQTNDILVSAVKKNLSCELLSLISTDHIDLRKTLFNQIRSQRGERSGRREDRTMEKSEETSTTFDTVALFFPKTIPQLLVIVSTLSTSFPALLLSFFVATAEASSDLLVKKGISSKDLYSKRRVTFSSSLDLTCSSIQIGSSLPTSSLSPTHDISRELFDYAVHLSSTLQKSFIYNQVMRQSSSDPLCSDNKESESSTNSDVPPSTNDLLGNSSEFLPLPTSAIPSPPTPPSIVTSSVPLSPLKYKWEDSSELVNVGYQLNSVGEQEIPTLEQIAPTMESTVAIEHLPARNGLSSPELVAITNLNPPQTNLPEENTLHTPIADHIPILPPVSSSSEDNIQLDPSLEIEKTESPIPFEKTQLEQSRNHFSYQTNQHLLSTPIVQQEENNHDDSKTESSYKEDYRTSSSREFSRTTSQHSQSSKGIPLLPAFSLSLSSLVTTDSTPSTFSSRLPLNSNRLLDTSNTPLRLFSAKAFGSLASTSPPSVTKDRMVQRNSPPYKFVQTERSPHPPLSTSNLMSDKNKSARTRKIQSLLEKDSKTPKSSIQNKKKERLRNQEMEKDGKKSEDVGMGVRRQVSFLPSIGVQHNQN